MQSVFVLDKSKNPLAPCHPARARQMLRDGKAAVYRRFPFTIILREREGGEVQPIAIKFDPGAKTTGVAVVQDNQTGKVVVWAGEIQHRGFQIKDDLLKRSSLRRGRRQRGTRYRQPRFLNRTRQKGWLPPSLRSRISNIMTWFTRLFRFVPVTSISMELVKFDTQLMQNPEIDGVQYQQGELAGYEVREYLLEKFGRQCVYCGKKDVPLQVEHINPRGQTGSNRVSNLTLACEVCNKAKGNRTAAEFGHPEVQALAKQPLRDAAAVNATRWAIWRELSATTLPVECGTGGRTKFNRTRQGYIKAHWIDAACVGESGERVAIDGIRPLLIRAVGHGGRQMQRVNGFGFPCATPRERMKRRRGIEAGDMVRVTVSSGKYAGTALVNIISNNKDSIEVREVDSKAKRGHSVPKSSVFVAVHRNDGYRYGPC